MFLSTVSLGFFLALDHRGRLEGKVGVLVRNLKTVMMIYWVNVSESFGAGSPSLSQGRTAVVSLVRL